MITNIFVNLAVKDLAKSKNFFEQLGMSFNPKFTDENAACLIIGPNMYSMLLTEKFFKTFAKKELADASKVTETLIALSAESKEEVDQLYEKAIKAGATQYRDTADYGWMYTRNFEDLDGHIWEILWMSPEAVEKGPAAMTQK